MPISQIKIELLDHAGGDRSVTRAARVSFDKEPEAYAEDQNTRLTTYLADHKHLTTFRHNFIQLRCHAPIFLARQLGKHQAGLTWSEVSRRYVDTIPEFYYPDVWLSRPDGSVKQGSGGTHKDTTIIKSWYEDACNRSLLNYNSLIDNGVAPEQARMFLPQGMMTTWIWSGNLLAFAHVYKERSGSGAQLEAQHFATQLNAIIRPLFPVSWAALVGETE